jgi:hypothetical protein
MTWNKIEVPSGNFIGWGRVGQQVTLHVIAYEAEGGRDFNGQACPQLVGKLTAPTDSHRKDGPPQNYQIGDIVTVTLDRPEIHNAFDDRLIADLHGAARRLGEDDPPRIHDQRAAIAQPPRPRLRRRGGGGGRVGAPGVQRVGHRDAGNGKAGARIAGRFPRRARRQVHSLRPFTIASVVTLKRSR